MAGRASALAVLGLPPGADAAAIEQAYKRLIKQHHPDREGGDSSRAAEINRAYRELRGTPRETGDPLQFNDMADGVQRGFRWALAALFLFASIGAAILVFGPKSSLIASFSTARAQMPKGRAGVRTEERMDERLDARSIDSAVRDAFQMFKTKDEMALASASRDCERRFRDHPGTEMLDRCAAFDDAVVGLEDRDPLRDEGPFAALAVTGRQWSAASALSDDDLAIDGRLDRIRLRVDLTLAALIPAAPSETLEGAPNPVTNSN